MKVPEELNTERIQDMNVKFVRKHGQGLDVSFGEKVREAEELSTL
jgi:hypothetical protein